MKNEKEKKNWGIYVVGTLIFITINFLTMTHFNEAKAEEPAQAAQDMLIEIQQDIPAENALLSPNAGFSKLLSDITFEK